MSATPGRPADGRLPACEIAVSQALIDAYAHVSGDFNTVHVDPRAGEAAGFGGTIAHGCIPMEPVFRSVCRWLGADVLPPGTTMRLRYRAPARPGDVVRADARIAGERDVDGRPRVTVAFACTNQHGTTVIDGELEVSP